MPLYDYECQDCGGRETAYRSVAQRNDAPACSACGVPTKKVISSYSIASDLEPYYDDNLETHIRSRKHRKQVMREKGVSEKFGRNWWTGANNRKRA